MAKFVVIYHMPEGAWMESENSSPEEMEKGMVEWMKWSEMMGDRLVDFGQPLSGGVKVNQDGTTELPKDVAGYSIIEANSMDHAAELLQKHPHIMWHSGCEITVHEAMPVPGN